MGKTVLVTGASRGIGSAVARCFAQQGWKVAVNYCQSQAQAQQLCSELQAQGLQARAFQADVSDALQVRRMISLVEAHLGEVDVLVNNAGIAQQKLFTQLTEDDWDNMFNVNVKGMYHCTQAVVRPMIARGAGSIVNLSSVWGMTGASCEVHYSAAKAAIIGFTKALAKELGPSGIRVNCVAPGVVDTQMNAALGKAALAQLCQETPLGRLGTAEEIAGAVVFLASDAASFFTGQVFSPNGGFVI